MIEITHAAAVSVEPRTCLMDITVVARSRRTAFSAWTGQAVSPRRGACMRGGGGAVSADWRDHDRVEGLLGTGGVVAVGLGYVAEAAVAAHDGDGRVAQAGQIPGQVAQVCPAPTQPAAPQQQGSPDIHRASGATAPSELSAEKTETATPGFGAKRKP